MPLVLCSSVGLYYCVQGVLATEHATTSSTATEPGTTATEPGTTVTEPGTTATEPVTTTTILTTTEAATTGVPTTQPLITPGKKFF